MKKKGYEVERVGPFYDEIFYHFMSDIFTCIFGLFLHPNQLSRLTGEQHFQSLLLRMFSLFG